MLLLATTTHAYWRGHWVAGVSAGLSESKGNLNIEMNYTALPLFPDTFIIHEHTNRRGFLGVLAGYTIKYCGWGVAGEVSVDWQDEDRYDVAFSDRLRVLGWVAKVSDESAPLLGLTAKLSYDIAPYFIPYMRLGLQFSKDELSVIMASNPRVLPLSVKLQDNRLQTLLLAGFGAEIPLPINIPLALRLEYNYRCYFHDTGLDASGYIHEQPFNPFFTVDTHPKSNSGKLSLVWNFS